MKLILASIGTGIVILFSLLMALLLTKIVFPDGGTERAIIALYIFCWPIALIRYFPGLSVQAMLGLSFAIGTLLNVAMVSVVAYLILRKTLTKRTLVGAAPSPPNPPSFDHSL